MKYKITARKTVTDPTERARRLNELYSIFEPKTEEEITPDEAKQHARALSWIHYRAKMLRAKKEQ